MPKDPRMLTHQQATTFYNHLGAKVAAKQSGKDEDLLRGLE